MGSCTTSSEWNAFRPDAGRIVQIKITEFRSTSDCDDIVWSGSCSKHWHTELSTVEKLQRNFILIRCWEIGIWKPGTMLWNGVQSPRVKKETKPMLKGKWKSVFSGKHIGQCSNGDPCSFSHDPLLASGKRGSSQGRQGRSSSLASHGKSKQTDGKKSDKEESSDKRSQILCRYVHCSNLCRVSFGSFPCVRTTSLKKVVFMATNTASDMLVNTWSPTRSRKKVVRKDQVLHWRSLHNWVVCLKILIRESLTWTRKIGNKTRRQILQKHLAPNQNSGKKGSIARYYPKVCASWA